MGLDVGFFRDEEEIFYLRNHHDFFELFDEQVGGRVDDIHDDFYVTLDTLDLVDARLEQLFAYWEIAESLALAEVPAHFYDLDVRDTELDDLLRYYPAFVELMRSDIIEYGPLICGWSA